MHTRRWAAIFLLLLGISFFEQAAFGQGRPLLEYRFEEGFGTSVANSGSRPGGAGTILDALAGGPLFSTDTPVGTASVYSLRFDGIDDLVQIPDVLDYTTDGAPGSPATLQLTVEAWVKPEALGGQRVIWDDYGNPGVLLALSGNVVQFSISTDLHPGAGVSSLSGKIIAGVWQHIAAVYDGTQMRIYVDGMDTCVPTDTSGAIRDNSTVNPGSAPIGIGADSVTIPALNFQGLVDDLRVYTRALTRSQLAGGFFANWPASSCGVPYQISEQGAASQKTMGTGSEVKVGYGRIQSNAGNAEPAGLAIFGLRQNGVLVTEAGVPASRLVQSGRIPAFIGGPLNTGVALANPYTQAVTVDFYFTDVTGTTVSQDRFVIPAYSQISRFLTDAPFNIGSTMSGSFTFTASAPVGAIALRSFLNVRGDFLITTLPVADITSQTVDPIILPHYADGEGWATEILLVNPGEFPCAGTLQFFDRGTATSSASPISMTVNGSTSTLFTYVIPAKSAQRLRTAGSAATVRVGSVAITPNSGSASPNAVVVFSLNRGNITVAEAGVPASRASTAFRMYIETAGDFNAQQPGSIQTGLAVTNPASTPIQVRFELFTQSGVTTGLFTTMSLPARGQTSMFLNQIPGLPPLPASFQGLLRVSTAEPSGLVVTGLRGRYNENRDFLFTTTPAADETAAFSSTELLFPHIVDGGGYSTQFILFGSFPGAPAVGRDRFFSQPGLPLNLTLQ